MTLRSISFRKANEYIYSLVKHESNLSLLLLLLLLLLTTTTTIFTAIITYHVCVYK